MKKINIKKATFYGIPCKYDLINDEIMTDNFIFNKDNPFPIRIKTDEFQD